MDRKWLVFIIIGNVVLIAALCLLPQGIKTFLFEPFAIPSGAMIPTIEPGDRVLANKLAIRRGEALEHGDIVVFDDPTGEYPQLISRIIGLEGDVIDLQEGSVLRNGEVLDEPYTCGSPTHPLGVQSFPLVVPEGSMLVMGDNRTNSADGRVYGALPIETVRGIVSWRYWPPDRSGTVE